MTHLSDTTAALSFLETLLSNHNSGAHRLSGEGGRLTVLTLKLWRSNKSLTSFGTLQLTTLMHLIMSMP
jgi:hypothetical protein